MGISQPETQADGASRKRRPIRLPIADRITLGVMAGVPLVITAALIIAPTIATIYLSFTDWDGLGGMSAGHWIGLDNYTQAFTGDPRFTSAIEHNLIWFVFLFAIPTPFGLLLAYLLDKEIRFSRIYQSAIFLPVVLSLAIIGFIWQNLLYEPDHGLVNNVLGTTTKSTDFIDWLGNSSINLWSILVAAGWRHAGYVMVLFLAGLKGVDPSQREAAAIDGASEWQVFRNVVFPALRPINVVVFVITVIEALRAFDLVYVMGAPPGTELLGILVTGSILGESSRVGYGSALATLLFLISTVFIVIFVSTQFNEREAGTGMIANLRSGLAGFVRARLRGGNA